MESNKLNKAVIDRVRSKVVVSNLEREEKMKMSRKKEIISIVALIVFLLGGFVTVNAATNGQVVEGIKGTIKMVFLEENEDTTVKVYMENESLDGIENAESYIVRYETVTDDVKEELEEGKIVESINANSADEPVTVEFNVIDN